MGTVYDSILKNNSKLPLLSDHEGIINPELSLPM